MTDNKKEKQQTSDSDSQSQTHIKNFQRREFIGKAVGGIAAAAAMSSTQAGDSTATTASLEDAIDISAFPTQVQDGEYEAVVIGSGFGGAVTAARTSKKWPGKTLMVERGKRYGRGEFPRTFRELSQSFWRIPGDRVPRVYPLWGEQRGIFDLRTYDHMDTLVAAGYGGGSLIYGVGIIEPVSESFDESWPESIKREKLRPYFDVFKTCMGAQKMPAVDSPQRANNRKDMMQSIADAAGKERVDVDVAVFFGNDENNPSEPGTVETNRYGAEQTSCTYCAECIVGCNFQAKNSVDLNYLYVAEREHGMEVRTEHLMEKMVPLNADGREDTRADGSFGYHLYLLDLNSKRSVRVKTRRVILSAGTYGTTEILFKNKQTYRTLPRISNQLGNHYSGNGDFITISLGSDTVTDSGKGPTITQYIDHTTGVTDTDKQFIAEDMSIPLSLFGSVVDILSPNYYLRRHFDQIQSVADINASLLVQVHVGLDKSSGDMSLNWLHGGLQLDWPYYENTTLYNEIIDATEDAKPVLGANNAFAFPTWAWPLRRNLTVHPLGGAVLADSADEGVISAKRGEMGRVFNYQNLYVADGSMVPSSLGSNPALTIGALSEMIAEDITGIAPSENLS